MNRTTQVRFPPQNGKVYNFALHKEAAQSLGGRAMVKTKTKPDFSGKPDFSEKKCGDIKCSPLVSSPTLKVSALNSNPKRFKKFFSHNALL